MSGVLSARRALAVAGAAVLAMIVAGVISLPPARGATASAAAGSPVYAIAHVLAYVRQTNTGSPYIWAADAGGAHARKLGIEEQPAVSPNGAMVAATSITGDSVLIYPVAGGRATTFKLSGSAYGLAWSPDSRYLAVNIASTALDGLSGAGIAVIDTTIGTVTMVAKGVPNGAGFAVNGTDELVYGLAPSLKASAPVNLFEVTPAGSGTRQLHPRRAEPQPGLGCQGDRVRPRAAARTIRLSRQ